MPTVDYKKELGDLISILVAEGGSDIHLAVGWHPLVRVTGSLIPLVKKPVLTEADVEGFIQILMPKERYAQYVEHKEIDFSFEHEDETRFRGNAFVQKGYPGVVLRHIPNDIKTIEELQLPPVLETFTDKNQGFFLCVGPVGQGKTTTLAALINRINQQRANHIVTIEDPVEYVYKGGKSLIDQREVGVDTESFETALNSAFRQDIDVVMVGEMRNRETIATAVTAAETGHLVFATLHTNNASQTVDRIIDSFPAGQQDQIRMQLSSSLLGIFSQRLVPRIEGGLVPAYELLINNKAVSNLIREGRTHEIQSVIETGMEFGMIDMNRSLADLVKRGEITVENAFMYAVDPKALDRLM